MASILLVEDDTEIAGYIRAALAEAGHETTHVALGREALARAGEGRHGLVVLDRMLPDLDGLAILEALRAARFRRPVLFLSALGAAAERVAGLRAGADDYLAKPFEMAELLARIDALLRRPDPEPGPRVLRCGDLELDPEAGLARRGGRLLDLKRREVQMLRFLLERRDRVVTRAMLLEGVWDFPGDHPSNIIEVHVSRLRRKVDAEGQRPLLHTIRGVGYVLSDSLGR